MTSINRTKEFRYVDSNGQQIMFSRNDVTILFGIKEDHSDPAEVMLGEVGVVMTPTSAKILAATLTRLIEHFESTNNTVIPIDASKSERLEELLRGAERRAMASSPSEPQFPSTSFP